MLRQVQISEPAFDGVGDPWENTYVMKATKHPKLPRGLRWRSNSPFIWFSWRDSRGRQHQQSTETHQQRSVLCGLGWCGRIPDCFSRRLLLTGSAL
jgi:hypothetical protein